MARNKGVMYWDNIVGMFIGKDLTNEDFKFCDSLDKKVKTESDKRILEFLSILIENNEQKESYFKSDMDRYINGVYSGKTDKEIIGG